MAIVTISFEDYSKRYYFKTNAELRKEKEKNFSNHKESFVNVLMTECGEHMPNSLITYIKQIILDNIKIEIEYNEESLYDIMKELFTANGIHENDIIAVSHLGSNERFISYSDFAAACKKISADARINQHLVFYTTERMYYFNNLFYNDLRSQPYANKPFLITES